MQEYDFKMLKLNTNTSVTHLNDNDVHEKLVLFHGHPIVTLRSTWLYCLCAFVVGEKQLNTKTNSEIIILRSFAEFH